MTIFRVDFGSDIGLGHLMRSLVYAKEFNEVIYISKSNQKELLPYPLITIKDEEEFFSHVKKLQPKEVIVDNYAFTLEYQKEFKKLFPDIKLSCFDDEYKEYFCDEIINHNISADITKYKQPHKVKIIPPLIRDEFKTEKQKKRDKIYDFFIALGGADTQNLTATIIKSLPKEKKICAVTTTANKYLKELEQIANEYSNVDLHVNTHEFAKLLHQSKFAIITPSVIVHEVLFMQIPFCAIKTASNQDDIYNYLKQHGYTVMEEFDPRLCDA